MPTPTSTNQFAAEQSGDEPSPDALQPDAIPGDAIPNDAPPLDARSPDDLAAAVDSNDVSVVTADATDPAFSPVPPDVAVDAFQQEIRDAKSVQWSASQRRAKKSRRTHLFRKRKRRVRCGQCHAVIRPFDRWDCPRCESDMREVGLRFPFKRGQEFKQTLHAIWRRLRREPRPGQGCAKCSYSIRGVPGFDCPECGANLRKEGVKDPDRIHRSAVVTLLLLLWFTAFPLLVWQGTDWVRAWMVPQVMERDEHLLLSSSDAGVHVAISGGTSREQWRWDGPPPLRFLKVEIEVAAYSAVRRPGGMGGSWLVVEFPKGEYAYGHSMMFGSGGNVAKNGKPISGPVVREFLHHAGLEPRLTLVKSIGEELTDILLTTPDEPYDLARLKALNVVSSVQAIDGEPVHQWQVAPYLYWAVLFFLVIGLLLWCGRSREWQPLAKA